MWATGEPAARGRTECGGTQMATNPTTTGYEETLADIEETPGIVPGWLDDLPPEDLVDEWPLNKRSFVGE